MSKSTRQLMLDEIADWQRRGLIDGATRQRLSAPYQRPGQLLSTVLQWLGIGSVLLIGMAVLGGVSYLSESVTLGVLLFFTAGAGLWWGGVRLARDPAGRMPVTGVAILTIGLMLIGGSLLLGGIVDEDGGRNRVPLALLVTAVLSACTAYRYHLRWPLFLGLLCIFHALGSWGRYAGSGSYDFGIQDPCVMAVIAGLAALLGLWHQHAEEGPLRHCRGFGRLYVIFGLLYFNCSLWFLSLERYGWPESALWILLFTLGAISQLVIGARFKHPSFIGFGVVFLGINLYTRFYEYAWDHLSVVSFFIAAGVTGIALGWLFERAALRAKEDRS
ncbi:hypothetical protein ALP29_01715 [Pseudomonas syringae pv. avii]|uniref:DUF2157 domain-containing protein n=1 Tax=Pseudomonas syringae pv. avii TaxID=663959 RepID=A0A3M5U7E3_PSESX|nr:DUF2157 domain-containing protein [Pseudomonas azotoformans]RMT59267.1 hypothetical protein ALP43_01105 [Pseudomonas azotoformans]RMU41117.1 hypothetical protein ALP29_01715 [Pseudomonas syringae pv. avii]